MAFEDERTPDPVAIRGWQVGLSPEDLRDYLDALNEQGVGEAVVLEREGAHILGETGMWLAYCTDPDGEWFLESGDPTDRMHDDYYDRVGLDFLANRGPFRVLERRTLRLPPLEFDRADPLSTLRALYQAAARGEAFLLAGREYTPVGSTTRWYPGVEV